MIMIKKDIRFDGMKLKDLRGKPYNVESVLVSKVRLHLFKPTLCLQDFRIYGTVCLKYCGDRSCFLKYDHS